MNIFSEIKKSVSCVDACRQYGIELDRHGFAICPFHNERSASFRAWNGDRGFHCFGCHASGSVIDLVMKLFDVSAGDACRRLSDDFRLGLYQEDNSSRSKRIAQNREAWERRRRERELEEQYAKLVTEWNDALYALRLIEIAYYEAAPKDPDEEWSECFVIAASRRDRARARADEALVALNEFEKQRFAS